MISKRTRHSLAQYLSIQAPAIWRILLVKHGADEAIFDMPPSVDAIVVCLDELDDTAVYDALREVVSTAAEHRHNTSPKILFEARHDDLKQCLLLDGYLAFGRNLVPADPSVVEAPQLEDDLSAELGRSGLARETEIRLSVSRSGDSFIAGDYNGALTHARVSLETLIIDIAAELTLPDGATAKHDRTVWGGALTHLRVCGLIADYEEKGLAGLYTFLSTGAHRPLGIPEAHMARLARSLGFNMCWFLLKAREVQSSRSR